MSVEYHTNLIVGVPVPYLGKIECKVERKNLFDPLGNITDESVDVKMVYLDTPPGFKYFIGSNRDNLIRFKSNRVGYFYHELAGEDEDEDEDEKTDLWIHKCSSFSCPPESVIVGLKCSSILDPVLYDEGSFIVSSVENVQYLSREVVKYLNERFGYTGDIYVVSQLGCT